MNKITILLLGIFLFSFASAQLTYQIDEEVNLTIVCLNDGYCSAGSYCNINVEDPSKEIIIQNKNMTDYGTWFGYNMTPTENGLYLVSGYCQDGSDYEEVDYYFMATIDGEEQTISKLLGTIVLILLMIGLMGLVKYNHDHTNFDKWDNEIKDKHKHMGQTMVRSIVYNLFKHTFLWYYFLGWLIVLTLNNVVYGYLSTNMGQYFTLIANVYSLGFFLVTIFMIGHTWSYIKNTFETLAEDNWGVGN